MQKPPWEQGVGKHRKIVPYLPDKFSSQVKQAIDSVIDLTKIPNSSRPDGSQITPPPLSAPELLWSQLLPPPEELLEPPATPEVPSPSIQETITVDKFEFTGNTAFSEQELATVTEPFTNRPITFAELLSARTAVTKLYTDNGYLTSGAFIPPQSLDGGSVTIAILEGGLDEIEVNGTKRLNSGYVRSRLEIATGKPLNVQHLLDALRLLQLDPLIENLSAELSTGSGPGTSLLTVTLTEANSWSSQIIANNGRSPSVGSFRRGVSLRQANLLGLGDGLSVSYTNTDGSDGIDLSYSLPINPHNGKVTISYGDTSSEVTEDPFNALDIESDSRYFDLTIRQPLVQTPTEEFALGLTASRRESETVFLEDLGFPSLGADEDGRTRVSAVRFFQEWTKRNAQEVVAVRSQFSLGLDVFDATVNNDNPQTGEDVPDSRFFAWRGQAQWVRLLATDSLLLIRGDIQLADQVMLPIEQFALGGLGSVRGYRQDQLLTDNGAFASAEVRLPILRVSKWDALLQLTPFVDLGTTWNNGDREDPDPNSLVSVGVGLLWQQGDRFRARLDWGIPLVSVDSTGDSLQENGVYFSIEFNPF
ncbi:MAG: ShlB/FhaC/HecB family hemolysin secretion/activation protein [Symploca sp. SIO3C6]|nr:ShlB/FhaC/HecB family hemolysin secretion/activation protein [Symploca sp. SIO3C6]NET04707.1 ShlB/FhaC/HecB family hemolysin secretion/activation protein [Symploca sp. SIO2B6]